MARRLAFPLLSAPLIALALHPAAARAGAPQEQDTMAFRNADLPLDARVADLVGRLTLEEKAAQLGTSAPAIPRLGIPAYDYWSEALHGVARAGVATVFPQAIGLAATWDTDLMHRVATAISVEARAKFNETGPLADHGIYEGLTFFSPNINIFRDPRWGRGMETYGEDPYLTGQMAIAFVRGMQGDDPRYLRTVATAKHYAVHSGPEPDRHRFDAVVSERDFRETYLPAFRAAVGEGGALSVMCAYNAVYGDPACASSLLLQNILRDEWGFGGYVVSDCGAISDIYRGHRTAANVVAAAAAGVNAGTDLSCGTEYRSLTAAVQAGLLSEAQVDTALTRVLETRFRLGLFDPPARVPFNRIAPSANDSEEHGALALETALESMVLLKNDGVLPLRSGIHRIAVIGPDANDVDVLLGNYNGYPSSAVTPLEGVRRAAAARGIDVTWTRGADVAEGIASLETVPSSALADLRADYFANHAFEGTPIATRTESTIDHQWWRRAPLEGMPADSFSVRWTGTFVPPTSGRYALGARAMGTARLWLDDSLVVQLNDRHVALARSASVELQAGTRHSLRLEFADRRADASVQLVWAPPAPSLQDAAAAAARDADVAVLFLGLSPRLEGEEMRVEVPGFSGGDRVAIDLPAPQQELLRAIVATGTPVLLVLVNGSALAVPWAAQHVPAILEAWYPGQAAGDAIADVLFGDASPAGRLPVTVYASVDDLPPFDDYDMAGRTYRYFTGQALFPFGHGLSYSTFHYSDLRVPERVLVGDSVQVSVEVENAGAMEADEVVQLYVSDVEASVPVPIRTLAGFRRVRLEPGARMRVSFTLAPDAFSLIDDGGRRIIEPGTFEISVGGKQPGQSGLADASTTQVLTARLEVAR